MLTQPKKTKKQTKPKHCKLGGGGLSGKEIMQEGALELIVPTAYVQHCTLQQPCIQCTAVTKKLRTKEVLQEERHEFILLSFKKKKKKVIHAILSILELN